MQKYNKREEEGRTEYGEEDERYRVGREMRIGQEERGRRSKRESRTRRETRSPLTNTSRSERRDVRQV